MSNTDNKNVSEDLASILEFIKNLNVFSNNVKAQQGSLVDSIKNLGLRVKGASGDILPHMFDVYWDIKNIGELNKALSGTLHHEPSEIIHMITLLVDSEYELTFNSVIENKDNRG